MDAMLIPFALVVFVTVVTPGPTVLLALTNGSRFGLRLAGWGVLGAAVSDVFLITAASLGLGAVLATSAFWFDVVKWFGVAYLAWLGFQMITSTGNSPAPEATQTAGPGCGENTLAKLPHNLAGRLFRKSFFVAATNPKGYLFFAAFLPQFVTLEQPLAVQYVMLGAMFVVIDVAVMAGYAMLGSRASGMIRGDGAKWLDRGCGFVMLCLAGTLALYRNA